MTAYVYLRVSCVFRPSRSGLGPVKINMSLGGTGGEAKPTATVSIGKASIWPGEAWRRRDVMQWVVAS